MIQQTVSRLLPLASAKKFWIITNEDSRREIARQIPKLDKNQIIAEPVGRNTAPAIGLAAFMLLRNDPNAVIGMFPSDHVIGNEERYRQVLKKGIEIATAGENIVVLGIRPTPGRNRLRLHRNQPGDAARSIPGAPIHRKARRRTSS